MKFTASNDYYSVIVQKHATSKAARDFQMQFRYYMRHCVRKGFCIEECFGVIWEETLERIRLDEDEQPEVYASLIAWAKKELGQIQKLTLTQDRCRNHRYGLSSRAAEMVDTETL